MSYKERVIKRMEGTRDCAIENARDLYNDCYDEIYPESTCHLPQNDFVWFKALEDARKIQAVIDTLKNVDESWVVEMASDFPGVI